MANYPIPRRVLEQRALSLTKRIAARKRSIELRQNEILELEARLVKVKRLLSIPPKPRAGRTRDDGRTLAIVKAWEQSNYNYSTVARRFALSRQRVHQIIKRELEEGSTNVH